MHCHSFARHTCALIALDLSCCFVRCCIPQTHVHGQHTYGVTHQTGLQVILPVQGLGEELAHYFAAHGARLILSSRKEEQLQVRFHTPLIKTSNFFTTKQGLLLLFQSLSQGHVQIWQQHNNARHFRH